MDERKRSSNLHGLVEATFLAHKEDIKVFASGHLNPDKLLKLPEQDTTTAHVPWESAKLGNKLENARDRTEQSKYIADGILVEKSGLMKHALLDFSVGTAGMLPQNRTRKMTTKTKRTLNASKSEAKLEALVLSEITKLSYEQKNAAHSTTSPQKDAPSNSPRRKYVLTVNTKFQNVLTEELKLPELMLPSVDEAVRVPPSLKDPQPTAKRRVQEMTDRKFFTTHLAGITRRDQFHKILDFDRNVLHRYETMEKNVRDGHKATVHLEQKLVRRLLDIAQRGMPTSSVDFERLQAYSEVWEDLCVDSPLFGAILSRIKFEYDEHLSKLLDVVKATDHAELMTCIDATGGLTQYSESDVEQKRGVVEALEEEGRNRVLKNAQLHKSIECEEEKIAERKEQQELEEEENRRRLIPLRFHREASRRTPMVSQLPARPESPRKVNNTEAKLKKLRADIWERLDEIARVQKELKTAYVPKTLHRNVQHAIQDTETGIQRHMQQNEYLAKNITDQVHALQTNLKRFDGVKTDAISELFSKLEIP